MTPHRTAVTSSVVELPAALLEFLPQPRHLFAALTRTRHFHLGLFDDRSVELGAALDRTSRLITSCLDPGRPQLDVGCGLGGTTVLLSAREVVGIDPCPDVIHVARTLARRSDIARYSVVPLEELPGNHIFGGLAMIEALQYFPRVDALVSCWSRQLGDDGTVAVIDVFARRSLDWQRAPFHTVDAVVAASASHFELAHACDLTRAALPTFRILQEDLTEQRARLTHLFARRPAIAAEIDELLVQIGHLRCAFEAGDLGYELIVLRRRDSGNSSPRSLVRHSRRASSRHAKIGPAGCPAGRC